MLKRLRLKIILVLMLLMSGVLLAVLAAQTVSSVRQYQAGTDQVLHAALQRSRTALDPWGAAWDGSLDRDRELYTAIPAFCALVDGEGQVLLALSYNAAVDQADVEQAVAAARAAGAPFGRLPGLGLRYRVERTGLFTQIAFADLTWEQTAVRQQVLAAGLIFAVAAAGFFAVSWFLSRWLVRPVEESWRRQQQFVADASHELKTPLTVLLADADILLAHQEETVGSQRKWVEYIQEEGLRMKGLVQDLLFLARGDAEGWSPPRHEALSLSDLCQGCALSFEPVAFERGVTLNSSVASGVTVAGREDELRRLCAILLDNACKYCDSGGTVTLTLEKGERAVLTVHNTGQPIPVQAQPHLFERFYRADAARSRSQGGYGLGLAIAAAITQGHRGKIDLRSAPGEGTAFIVPLPLSKRGA